MTALQGPVVWQKFEPPFCQVLKIILNSNQMTQTILFTHRSKRIHHILLYEEKKEFIESDWHYVEILLRFKQGFPEFFQGKRSLSIIASRRQLKSLTLV